MRQQIEKRYLENGSFYVLVPSLLREKQNRLGGRIGMQLMERHKMFQIDRPEDIKLCAAIMRSYGYA
jgi:N-acylneuraminate cytidylyltransferase